MMGWAVWLTWIIIISFFSPFVPVKCLLERETRWIDLRYLLRWGAI